MEIALEQSIGHFKKEVKKTPRIVREFEGIFDQESTRDEKIFRESRDSYYALYRSLKETMRSSELNKEKFKNSDLRLLSNHLLNSEKYGSSFREWIRTREWEWERKTLPVNAYRIYALGKQEILRREGKK